MDQACSTHIYLSLSVVTHLISSQLMLVSLKTTFYSSYKWFFFCHFNIYAQTLVLFPNFKPTNIVIVKPKMTWRLRQIGDIGYRWEKHLLMLLRETYGKGRREKLGVAEETLEKIEEIKKKASRRRWRKEGNYSI